jgi:demethylmenaquinone methyltransferase / 2-methoxy-6-polyprenyl-1,4-benzoquinol methylase
VNLATEKAKVSLGQSQLSITPHHQPATWSGMIEASKRLGALLRTGGCAAIATASRIPLMARVRVSPSVTGMTYAPPSPRALFAPLGPTYDRVGAVLSLGQDPRWRRFLVSRLPSGGHVLDVATGTGLVAAELRRRGHAVTGVDQSPEMLAVAHRRFGGKVELIHASAEALPFENDSFDHVTFTYLLRYVANPAATLAELARVVRPGGIVASLEFGVPPGSVWGLYVRTALPLAGLVVGNGWREVGNFLGGSIRDFWRRHPLESQVGWWNAAGVCPINVRRLSIGAAVVMWGRKTESTTTVLREAS